MTYKEIMKLINMNRKMLLAHHFEGKDPTTQKQKKSKVKEFILAGMVTLLFGAALLYIVSEQFKKLGSLKTSVFSQQQNQLLTYNMSGDLFDFHFFAQFD